MTHRFYEMSIFKFVVEDLSEYEPLFDKYVTSYENMNDIKIKYN